MKQSVPEFRADPLFAAANSGKGFVSFYSEIFSAPSIERRFIIKGGPGTGKSSFMKRISAEAEARGRTVEHYRCSSDPSSLDGIVIDGKIAVIDGTAPHSEDTELAGARDDIIDLGAFWDSDTLRKKRADIELLREKKSECYKRAYRYLSACDGLFAINRSLVLPAVKLEKLERAAERILDSIPRGKGTAITPAIADSVGMRGRVRFDSYERSARKLYVLEDHFRTAHLFLRALITGALQKDCTLRVSYDPVHVSEPDAVYFCHTGDCFVISDGTLDGDVRINMKRFVNADKIREVRSELRSNERIYEAMLGSACEALKMAGEHHFALEQIYSETMDFEAQTAFCSEFVKKLFED
jgi:hypothetical protein